MSGPMAALGVLHVIIGGCAVTKLLLMRFHKAPNQPAHHASWLIHLKIIHSQRQSLTEEQGEGLSSPPPRCVFNLQRQEEALSPTKKYHYP